MPRRRGVALPLAVAPAAVACSFSYRVNGQLAAEDGATGVECSIGVQDLDIDPPYGRDACRAEADGRAPETEAIPLGSRFRCRVDGDTDGEFEVQVRCPGYAPLDVPLVVEACTSFFRGCDDIELGTLTVRR